MTNDTDNQMSLDGWRLAELGEVCELRGETVNPAMFAEAIYVGLEHIDSGESKLKRYGKGSDVTSSKSRFYTDDVLYGKLRPYLDKSFLAEFDGICSSDILVFKSKEELDCEFLSHRVHQADFTNYAIRNTTGVNHPRTSWTALKQFEFLLPSLSEQRAIAKVLNGIQGAKETRQTELRLERERKNALLDFLFTYGTRNENLRQTEIGEIPKNWEVIKLGRHCKKPEYGYTASATNVNTDVKFLRITDVQNGNVNWQTVPFCECSETNIRKYLLESHDLVFARIGATTGKSFLIRNCPKTVFASYLIRVRTKDSLSPDYLNYFCQTDSYWRQVNQVKGGKLKGGVNIPTLQNLKLPLPSLKEQVEIAKVLEACDKKLSALEDEINLLNEFFKAMLEMLMSGELSSLNLAE